MEKKKVLNSVLSLAVLSALIPALSANKKVVVSAEEENANPIAKYEFKDASNPGKDSMGNYDLVAVGNVSVADGVATFDGSSMLQSANQDEDFGENLESFTLAFEIKATGTNGSWAMPIGFGWNDWNATKWGTFEFSDNSDLLRFSAQGIDANENPFWAPEIGSLGTEAFHKVILSAQQGGKMNVYLDGSLKYSYDMPENYTFSDAQMKFAIGGVSVWNNDVVYTGFNGSLRNVEIYDFAMGTYQVDAYTKNGGLTNDDLTKTIVDPLSKYEFNDAANPGKDSMGNNDLTAVGNVSVADGAVTFDGASMLQSANQDVDFGETLDSFTLAFDIKASGTNGSWAMPIGFGWNDWNATKWGTFEFSDNSDLLRFSAQGIDANENPYWAPEIGSLGTENYHRVVLSAKQGGKMNVYLDGVLKYSYDMPENYTFSDTQMKFALGGVSVWNNDVVYTGFNGSLRNVEIYDFAMDEIQMVSYNLNGYLTSDDIASQQEINPISKYEFNDAANPGKDSVGSNDLTAVGNVSVADGVVTFDGSSMLQSANQDVDFGETLDSFTLAFDIKATATNGSWAMPIGFGWNDWNATKWGTFEFSDNSDLLRFSAQGIDANENPYWAPEIGSLGTEDFHRVVLSAKQGGKMNVYLDGVLKYSYDMPENYTFSDTQMKFALGGVSVWNNDVVYTGFNGSLRNVTIYDCALNDLQVAQYTATGKAYNALSATVKEANYDFTDTIKVASDASDAEILASVPKSSTVMVTMSNDAEKEAIVKWTGVVEIEGEKYLEGEIQGLVNTDNVKAYAKISSVDATILAPVAHYEFNDASHPGKDSMGNYHLEVKAIGESEANISIADGVATFDGTAGLIATDDMSDALKEFTLVYTIKGSGAGDWSEPVGFGWNDWNATKWATFMFASGSQDLRFSACGTLNGETGYSDIDNNVNPYWGTVVGTVSQDEFSTVILTVVPGDKINVYFNGKLGYSFACPEDFTLDSSTMFFTIGANGTWGGARMGYVGQIGDVAIYDFAANESQVAILTAGYALKDVSCDEAYVKAINEELKFAGEVTSEALNDSLTLDEMLAKVNAATVTATLSNGETFDVPVVWTYVEEDDGKYYANGYYELIGQSVATVKSANVVRKELTVSVVTYNVTCKATTNGSVSVDKTTADHDSTITITPVANDGYEVETVKVNGEVIEAKEGKYTFTLTADSEVEVTFKEVKHDDPTSEDSTPATSEDSTPATSEDSSEVTSETKKDFSTAASSETKDSTSDKADDTTKKGCKGSAIPSIFGLVALVGAFLTKKRK